MTREELTDEIWSVLQNVQDYDTGLHDFAKAIVRDVPLVAAAPDFDGEPAFEQARAAIARATA